VPCVTVALRSLLKESGNRVPRNSLRKYEDAIHLDLRQWAIEEFGLSLRVENEARMALLGKQFAGAARGVQEVAMITLGTGIGGATMMLGELVRGAHA
jgi:glucokinase